MTTTASPTADRLARLGAAAEHELRGDILPFWLRLRDERRGGFFGAATSRGRPLPSAAKGAVLHARILWTLSNARERWPGDVPAQAVDAAFSFLTERLWDAGDGGVVWTAGADGGAAETTKHLYAQAFAIYGLAACHAATGEPAALDRAREIFALIETRAAAPAGGYGEAFTRDWAPAQNVLMSPDAPPRTFNAHFHLLEAYAALLDIWPDATLAERTRSLFQHLLDRAFDPATCTFRQTFDQDWRPLDEGGSFGHDIEASWLMPRIARALGESGLAAPLAPLALAVRNRALRPDGAVRSGAASDDGPEEDILWWVQAEALAGFAAAHARTGDPAFLEAAERVWAFVQSRVVDPEYGEWRERLDADARPRSGAQPKAHAWKCPYHNGRACLELIDRAENA